MITVTADVPLRDLLEDGPEEFAKRVRALLEAELQPLLKVDWKKVSPPGHPARLQDVAGH